MFSTKHKIVVIAGGISQCTVTGNAFKIWLQLYMQFLLLLPSRYWCAWVSVHFCTHVGWNMNTVHCRMWISHHKRMTPVALFVYTDRTKVVNLLLLTTNSRILCKFSIMGKTGRSLIEIYSHCTEFCPFSGLEFCMTLKHVGCVCYSLRCFEIWQYINCTYFKVSIVTDNFSLSSWDT